MRYIWLLGIAMILILLFNSFGLAQPCNFTGTWANKDGSWKLEFAQNKSGDGSYDGADQKYMVYLHGYGSSNLIGDAWFNQSSIGNTSVADALFSAAMTGFACDKISYQIELLRDRNGTAIDQTFNDTFYRSGPIQNITPSRNVTIRASKDGYVPAKKVIDNSQNFEHIDISGNVTDNSTGMPIKDAKVEIVLGANNASTSTDANGNYSITAIVPNGSGSDTRKDINIELIPSQYIVGVSEITPAVTQLIEENGGIIVDQIQSKNGTSALLVTVPKEKDINRFLANVGSSPLVKYVELNGLVYAAYVPNDPLYPLQWGPPNIRAGGLPNPSVWDTERGDKNVTIGVVDTGIQYEHEDLYRFKDGTVKYTYGYNWVNRNDDPSPVIAIERHGTHCTGIATAIMDNKKGIAGIAPNCSFIAERALDQRGVGTFWDISRAIMDASDHGADVISMSLGAGIPSNLVRDATLYASHFSILVAAAGNFALAPGYKGGILYPAAYPWVIAVGATDPENHRAPFSQWGKELALVAPGVNILSTVPGTGYRNLSGYRNISGYLNLSGTSMATPHVAGVAALVKSRAKRWPAEPLATYPKYHLNNEQIYQVLIQSAVDLGSPGWDEEYGYGKVDAGQAVRCVNISGNVLEALLGEPIHNAEVRVTSIDGPSGVYTTRENTTLARLTKDGDYFIRVPPGVYSICAMAYGYIPSQELGGERVDVPAFDINGKLYKDYRTFRLVPFVCNVTGKVTDKTTGMPITDVSISLDGPRAVYAPNPKVHFETKTNSRGSYNFTLEYGLTPEGPYNVTVNKPGYFAQTENFTLSWDAVMTNFYKCKLDPRDFHPPVLDFSLVGSVLPPTGRVTTIPTSNISAGNISEGNITPGVPSPTQPGIAAQILDYTMASSVNELTGNVITRTSVFSSTDSKAYSWLNLSNVGTGTLEWRWYSPDNNLYFTTSYNIPKPSGASYWETYDAWHNINIAGTNAADLPGSWHVDVYLNGKYLLTENFTIIRSSSPTQSGITVQILDHTMAKDVDKSTNNPIMRTNGFSSTDSSAYSWIRLGNVGAGTVVWKWYPPSSSTPYTGSVDISMPPNGVYWNTFNVWDFIGISGYDSPPGDWHVDIYLNGQYILKENFTLAAGGVIPSNTTGLG